MIHLNLKEGLGEFCPVVRSEHVASTQSDTWISHVRDDFQVTEGHRYLPLPNNNTDNDHLNRA